MINSMMRLRVNALIKLILFVSVLSCSASAWSAPGVVQQQQIAEPDVSTTINPQCRQLAISGRVFYNDQRRYGRFALRRDPEGNTGERKAYGEGDFKNYLGLREATVRLYEVSDSAKCKTLDKIADVAIDKSGRFEWDGEVCACAGGVQIAAKIMLRNCIDADERCFSVKDPEGAPKDWDHYDTDWNGSQWERWHRSASNEQPAIPHPLLPKLNLADDYFQEVGSAVPVGHMDLYSQAANVFASMVDVTRSVHLKGNVSFDYASYGETEAFFPNVTGGTAHSHQANRLCISAPQDLDVNDDGIEDLPRQERVPNKWLNGDEAAHEYGHLVHYQAWDGYGKWTDFCYLDNCDVSTRSHEYALAAFKEAWADFVRDVTFDSQTSAPHNCARNDDDGARACHGPEMCTVGRRVVVDVEKVLCDWWDQVEDCTSQWGGNHCDTSLAADLAELRDVLWHVWITASQKERDNIRDAWGFEPPSAATATLGLCRFTNTYIDLYPWREDGIVSALTRNGIICGID